jgi:hypothetical protein
VSLTRDARLARRRRFVRRVQVAAVAVAVRVGGEPYDGTQTALARRALAIKVLTDPASWGQRLAYAVAAHTAITTSSSDDDLDNVLTTAWNALAGAYPAPPAPSRL